MIAALRRNVASLCFKNLSFRRKSHVGLQTTLVVPLLHFSTSTQSTLSVYEFLVHKHHFSPQTASRIASVVTRLRNLERSDSVLSFLKENGFSNSQLENAVKGWPQLLSRSVEKTFRPRIKIFQDYGLSASDIAEILSKYPTIWNQSTNKRIVPSLTLLKTLLGVNGLGKLLKTSDAFWFFRHNVDNSLEPNIKLLKKCGVPMDHIISTMQRHNRFLLRNQEVMKKIVDKVDKMGVRSSSKQFIHAVRVIAQMSDQTLELKLRTLRKAGFREDDIAGVFRKSPTLLGLSSDKIKERIEFLLAHGKYDLSCIVSYPVSLTFSIEKRYKPRLQVLELLEGKNLIQSWPALATLCTMTDEKFYEKYVAPFVDEIGDHVHMKKGNGKDKGAPANVK